MSDTEQTSETPPAGVVSSTPKGVQRGVALLDEVKPGWDRLIDPTKLDLSSVCNCVLGQLEGHEHPSTRKSERFERQLERLPIPAKDPWRFGFLARWNQSYETLTAAWWAVIQRRRAS